MQIKLRYSKGRITGWKLDSFDPSLVSAEIIGDYKFFRKYYRWHKVVDGILVWDDQYKVIPEGTIIIEDANGKLIPCSDLRVVEEGQFYITPKEGVELTVEEIRGGIASEGDGYTVSTELGGKLSDYGTYRRV